MPAGKDQLAECSVLSFGGGSRLDKHKQLRVNLVTQDVK